jgi:AbrB family looped-hinge helix DNA binding protein
MGPAATHPVTIGDRGRLVVPQQVRERHGWEAGTALVAIDTNAGMLVMSVDEGLAWLRHRLQGRDLVAELLEERRAEVVGGPS